MSARAAAIAAGVPFLLAMALSWVASLDGGVVPADDRSVHVLREGAR